MILLYSIYIEKFFYAYDDFVLQKEVYMTIKS